MALAACPVCNRQVSTSAAKCPHCGEKFLTSQMAVRLPSVIAPASQHTVPCPSCQRPINSTVKMCPHCGDPLVNLNGPNLPPESLPPVHPPPLPGACPRIQGLGITAGEFLDFTNSLLDCEVDITFPQSQRRARLSQFRSCASHQNRSDYLTDPTNRFVAREVMLKDGHLFLQMGSSFFLAIQQMAIQKHSSVPRDLARAIYGTANRFLSCYQIGLARDELREIVSRLIEATNDASLRVNSDRWLRIVVSEPTEDLMAALREWNSDPGYSNTTFLGGGFGLSGAAKGMAVSYLLNSCVAAYNQELASRHTNAVDRFLSLASKRLVMVRALFAQRINEM